MDKAFIGKEKETMNRLIYLQDLIALHDKARKQCIRNYRAALSAYGVEHEEVEKYKVLKKTKRKLNRCTKKSERKACITIGEKGIIKKPASLTRIYEHEDD